MTVRAEDVDAALDVLVLALPQGVHERDLPEGHEIAWYEGPVREDLEGRFPDAVDWRVDDVSEDFDERRQLFGHTWVIDDRLVVRSPKDPRGPEGLPEILLESDAGQFGTGAHPTTRDSLRVLLDLEPEGSFADLGCGAGVLAIAAAMLGCSPVIAIDYLPGSVAAARQNAALNRVDIQVHQLDLLKSPPPPATVLAANIPLPVHHPVASHLTEETRAVIISGIVRAEVAEALGIYAKAGFSERDRRETGGWMTLLVARG